MTRRSLLITLSVLTACADDLGTAGEALVTPGTIEWPMFHRDQAHTGRVAGQIGNFPLTGSPHTMQSLWSATVAPAAYQSASVDLRGCYRFYGGFPVADIDGDQRLDVIVTTPDLTDPATGSECVAGLDQSFGLGKLIALHPGTATPPTTLWHAPPQTGPYVWGCSEYVDQYSSAVVNAESGNSNPDVLFTTKSGMVRAVNGSGAVVWYHDTGRFIEAGPMIADVDGDGTSEVLVVTDNETAPSGGGGCTHGTSELLVYRAVASGQNLPLVAWAIPNDAKADSEEPAVVDFGVAGFTKTVVFGTWNKGAEAGRLYALTFQKPSGTVNWTLAPRVSFLPVTMLPGGTATAVIRSSPVAFSWGSARRVAFTWMNDYSNPGAANLTALDLRWNGTSQNVDFDLSAAWTRATYTVGGQARNVMDWKATLALIDTPSGLGLVTAGGYGQPGQTGAYGICTAPQGWLGVVRADSGDPIWTTVAPSGEGNLRASPAVADLDGDGDQDFVEPFGCNGMIRGYSQDPGGTFTARWVYQTGDGSAENARSINSPTIADTNGDGKLDVVVGAFDGTVRALGFPAP